MASKWFVSKQFSSRCVVAAATLLASFPAYSGGADLAASTAQSTRPDIIYLTDVDPAVEVDNITSSHDINSQLLPLYSPYLQGFNIQPRFVNSPRAQALLRENANVCRGKSVYNDERAQYAYASDLPQVVFPPLRLYMLASHPLAERVEALQQESENRHLSLAQVLALSPDLTLGLVRGRSYGEALDDALNADNYSNQLWIRSSPDQASGLFDMLVSGRIDLTIHTSVAMERFIQMRGQQPPELKVIPLQEAEQALLGYALCNKSEQGQAFLAAMTVAVRELSQTRAYFDLHMSWVPEAEQPYLAALYNQVYGTNFQP